MLVLETIRNMKNNYQIYKNYGMLLAILLMAQLSFAQKTSKRYSENDIMAEAKFIEADALFILGSYQEAADSLKKFVSNHPQIAVAHFQLGRAYMALQQDQKGMQEIAKAVQLDGSNRWFLIKQAQLFEANGQADLAAKTMEQLAKLDTKSSFGYKKAAYYYLLAQNPDAAMKVLQKGAKNVGFDADILYRQHIIYLAKGNTKKATQVLQNILKYEPQNTEIRLKLAEIFNTNNQTDLAEKQFRQILTYDHYNGGALLGLQRRMINQGNVDNAALLTLVKNPDINIDLKIVELVPIVNQASPKSKTTELTEWSPLFDGLMQTHPKDAKAFSVAGDYYNAIGQIDKALVAYQKALKLEKSVYPVWQVTLELLFYKKSYDKVISTANEALNFFPNKSKIVLFLAEAQYRNGLVKKAITNYQQAGFISGRNAHQKRFTYGRLAEIYLAQNKKDKARKYLDKALQLDDAKDPFIQHVEKEFSQNKQIMYGQWIQVYPFGVLLI